MRPRPSSGTPERALAAALVGLVLGTGVLWARLTWIRRELIARLARVDPATGYLIEELTGEQRALAVARGAQHSGDAVLAWTVFAVICMTAVLMAVWRMDRDRGIGLLRVAVPLAALFALGLGLGLLGHLHFQDELARIHQLVSTDPLETSGESCIPRLRPCARVVAFETTRKLTLIAVACVGSIGLIPAGVVAWRSGEHGSRLGKRWSYAAVACFVVGLVVLVLTRAHRHDRIRVLELCDPSAKPGDVRSEPWPNLTSEELVAVPVQRCSSKLWPAQREQHRWTRFELLAAYQVSMDGELALLIRPGSELSAAAVTVTELGQRSHDGVARARMLGSEELVTIVALYGDARLTMTPLAEYFQVMREAGSTKCSCSERRSSRANSIQWGRGSGVSTVLWDAFASPTRGSPSSPSRRSPS